MSDEEKQEVMSRLNGNQSMSSNWGIGHSSVTATSSYIGVTDNSALDLARTYSFWWEFLKKKESFENKYNLI